jgi:hypothetical protein
VSKKHSARKHRKKRARKRGRSKSTAALLASLAEALNACERRGMQMQPGPGGGIFCRQGVLLPPVKKDDEWLARPARPRPDTPVPGGWDDD